MPQNVLYRGVTSPQGLGTGAAPLYVRHAHAPSSCPGRRLLGAWAWRSEPEGGGGAAAERARWGGAGCLRACGVSLVGRGTLLCCLLALGPNPDNSRTVGGATTDGARWGGAGCLGACGVNLVGAGRCGVA